MNIKVLIVIFSLMLFTACSNNKTSNSISFFGNKLKLNLPKEWSDLDSGRRHYDDCAYYGKSISSDRVSIEYKQSPVWKNSDLDTILRDKIDEMYQKQPNGLIFYRNSIVDKKNNRILIKTIGEFYHRPYAMKAMRYNLNLIYVFNDEMYEFNFSGRNTEKYKSTVDEIIESIKIQH